MNEQKIHLPDFLIADLYKGSLVDLNRFGGQKDLSEAEETEKKTNATAPAAEKIKFFGENKKKLTVLVNQPEAVFLIEKDLTFLINILKACQLFLADIAIINVAKQQVSFEEIKEQMEPKNILLFDVDPVAIKLPFLIPAFQLQQFSGCTIMVAPPLSYLNQPTEEGKVLKSKLWVSLKKIFNL